MSHFKIVHLMMKPFTAHAQYAHLRVFEDFVFVLPLIEVELVLTVPGPTRQRLHQVFMVLKATF